MGGVKIVIFFPFSLGCMKYITLPLMHVSMEACNVTIIQTL